MLEERKKKLIKYLYPNEKLRQFLCEELYFELADILPKELCISTKTMSDVTRRERMTMAKNNVKQFLKQNPSYIDWLKYFFKDKTTDEIVDDLIIGYVFYLANAKSRFDCIDIFRDKRSLCYCPISVIDIL